MEITSASQDGCEEEMLIQVQDDEILFWRNFAKDMMRILGDSAFKIAFFSSMLKPRSHIDYFNLEEPVLSFLGIRHWEFDEYRDQGSDRHS